MPSGPRDNSRSRRDGGAPRSGSSGGPRGRSGGPRSDRASSGGRSSGPRGTSAGRPPRSPRRDDARSFDRDDRPRRSSAPRDDRYSRDERAPRGRASERDDRPRRSSPPRDDRYLRDERAPRGRSFDRDDRPRRSSAPRDDRYSRDERAPRGRASERDDRPRRSSAPRDDRYSRGERAPRGRGRDFEGSERPVRARRETVEPTPAPQWERVDRPKQSPKAKDAPARKPYALPAEIAAEIRRSFVGTVYQREKLVSFMTDAAEAYDRHRYEEALRLAKNVALTLPTVAPAQELAGLAAYRAQRYPMARKFLRAHFELTGDGQHLPLVIDCERASRRYTFARGTFTELLESEPNIEVLSEGRIVFASTLADQGKFQEAIELLVNAGASKVLRNPSARHVRLWYSLGDIYDRAGDAAGARDMFARVVAIDAEAYDAFDRLRDLGGASERKSRKKPATVSKKKLVD